MLWERLWALRLLPPDMDRELIRRRLMNASHEAKVCAGELLAADKSDHPLVHSLLLRYISIRYFLDEDEMRTDDLYELAEISVAKTMAIKREKLADIDIPGTCTGASSATSKKILLLMALRRDLVLSLDPERAADLKTVDQLAAYIELELSQAGAGKEEP